MKAILISGASSGIGEAFAKRLAAENHNVVLVARNTKKLETLSQELQKKYNIKAHYIPADLTQVDIPQFIFNECQKRGLEIDMLINNAGIGSGGDYAELNLQSELDMMQLNMQALVAMTHLFTPQMRTRKSGTIINVASMAAFQPIPYMAVYAASKAFVRSFTEAIAEENKPYGIHTMLLCPGATDTNFFDAADMTGDKKKKYSDNGNMQTPEQVVDAAMKGLRQKKTVAISGTKNKWMVRLCAIIPNSMITSIAAKQLDPKKA